MSQYGKNMVLIETENGQTKDEIIAMYNEFSAGTRQEEREAKDREFLASISDNEFQAIIRQYTGHDHIPSCSRVNGKLCPIFWISNLIRWPPYR